MIRAVTLSLALLASNFAYASAQQTSAYDTVSDLTAWTLTGYQQPTGNELFENRMVVKELTNGWTYDEDQNRATQCNKEKHNCLVIACDMGMPKFLISDPANRGYRIRFWSLDREKKTRTPMSVVDTQFDLDATKRFGEPTVAIQITENMVAQMTFGNVIRIAYSYPLAGIGPIDGANEIFIHAAMSNGKQADPKAWFKWCQQTAKAELKKKQDAAAAKPKAEKPKKKKRNKKRWRKRRNR